MSFIKKYKMYLILIIGIMFVVIINYDEIFKDNNIDATQYSDILITADYQEPAVEHIIVDIKGEVKYPGFYEVPSYLRVGDIINIAGGLLESANLTEINLASKIYDEMIITIPSNSINDQIDLVDEIVKVVVEVKGEVNNPGVYEIYYNSRVSDLINEAGGLTGEANISEINLAEKVYDEMVILIPKKINDVNLPNDDLVKIIVEIKGEVSNPGVYELYANSRVNDLIELAGGFTVFADCSEVNLSDILTDCELVVIPKQTTPTTSDTETIIVEIKGEVKNPGIYYTQEGLRVYHMISKSGGALETADLSNVDQAEFLVDGMTIVIPSKEVIDESEKFILVEIYGEVIHPGTYSISENDSLLDLIYEAGGVTVDCDISKIDFDITLCLGAKIYIPTYSDDIELVDYDGLVNINTSDLETLMTLPGIGQILGQRIIDYRSEYGGYLSIEDIMNVSGIKESIYEEVKELIVV